MGKGDDGRETSVLAVFGKEALKELGPQQWRSTFLALGSIAGSVHFAYVAQKESEFKGSGSNTLRRYAWGCSVLSFACFLTFAFEGTKALFMPPDAPEPAAPNP